ncbi:MAG: lipoate--protein ligase family protein [Spirochaetales bacterium]
MVYTEFLEGDDPWVHLAVEETRFEALQPGDRALLFYVNRPCVVLGKHQNPLREVRFGELATRKLPLLRRSSGGGTVYQDLGNLNYSFLWAGEGFDKQALLGLVAEALNGLGRPVQLTAQGDLVVPAGTGFAKVSGTASQLRRDRALVHGTLLCSADLEHLHGVLGPTGELVEWVGVSSRPQPVTNLGLELREAATAITRQWELHLAPVAPVAGAVAAPATGADAVLRHETSLRSHAWTFDRTPPFTWRGDTRQGDLTARVEDGRIVEAANLSRMVGKSFFSSEFFDVFD